MTNMQEKIYRSVQKRPRTFAEVAKICGYDVFDEFYNDGDYRGILDNDFWKRVDFIEENDFEKSLFVSIDNNTITELEERRRTRIYAWVPITISLIALIGAFRQELFWLLQAIAQALK